MQRNHNLNGSLRSSNISIEFLNSSLQLLKQVASQTDRLSIPAPESWSRSLLRKKFAECQQAFNFQRDGNLLVSLVARVSPTIRDANNRPVGMIGFFTARPESAAIKTTLEAAVEWLQQQGCVTIIGPIDGDTWHSYRFNVGPSAQAPFLMEPNNPDYYPTAWESAQFGALARYHSKRVGDVEPLIEQTAAAASRAQELGYRLRPLNLQRFEDELRIIFELSLAAFQDNLMYDEISWEEFQSLYLPSRPLLNERLVWFAVDANDHPVGFLFCLVDYYRAVVAMRGSNTPIGKLRFLFNRRHADAVNFKSIAVLPEHRKSSIGSALMHQGYRETVALGYKNANLCLIQDDNPSSKLDRESATIFRRYVLYQYAGGKVCH